MKNLLFISLIIVFAATFTGFTGGEAGDEEYLAYAEVMPQPVGGLSSIIKNVKYPEIAQRTNIQGKVYVMAFIDENGTCTDVKVIRGIGGGCDEAAAKAVKNGKYNPGKNKGKAVKVKLSLPVMFKL